MASRLSPFSVQQSEGGTSSVQLNYGSVLVGRGQLLEVRDKQVSRNHAELLVDPLSDKLSIKSVHSNPTFVRKLGTERTIVLKKGERVGLCHGDSFSFLPKGLEFRVQSSNEGDSDKDNILDQTQAIDTLDKRVEQTTAYDMLDKPKDQIEGKYVTYKPIEQTLAYDMLDKPIEPTLVYSVLDKNTEQTQEHTVDGTVVERNAEQTIGYSMIDTEDVATLENDYNETLSISSPLPSPPTEPLIPDPASPPTEPLIPDPVSPPTEPLIPDPTPPATEPLIPDPAPTPTEPLIPDPTPIPTEPLIPDPAPPPSETVNKKKRKLPSWMLDSSREDSAKSVSKRASLSNSKPADTIPHSTKPEDTDPKPCSSTTTSDSVEKEDIHTLTTDRMDTSSSSPKREEGKVAEGGDEKLTPCPYGAACYRKNPDHIKNFSHLPKPSDTLGAKKLCPYGSKCYRKNPEHFQEFSHSSRDSGARRRREKKPRAAKAKKRSALDGASDDDGETNVYDLKDDFIDNSCTESSDSSTEFESSESEGWQPDEEIGGLVDEATSFMKNPKMVKKV